MILKIKEMADRKYSRDSWKMFDNIENFSYTVYTDPVRTGGLGVGVIEHSFIETKPANDDMLFCAFMSGPQGINIWCNTEAYLLNDNGKTIERLI